MGFSAAYHTIHHGRYISILSRIYNWISVTAVASSAPLFLPWQKSQSEGKFNPGYNFRVWKRENEWRGNGGGWTQPRQLHNPHVIIHHIFVIINCCFVTSPGSHTHTLTHRECNIDSPDSVIKFMMNNGVQGKIRVSQFVIVSNLFHLISKLHLSLLAIVLQFEMK